MSKKLFCESCRKYLGEIRDAKLHKDIKYLCKSCNTQRESLELMYKDQEDTSYTDIFDIMFNNKGGL